MKLDTRLILANAGVTLILIFILNFLSNGFLLIFPSVQSLIRGNKSSASARRDRRVDLPNYSSDKDKKLAKIHFQEFKKLSTQYEAFTAWSRKPFQGQTITINSQGDRIHKNEIFGENFDKSIYFFGGSTTWGTGVLDQDTIPALFNSISGIPTFNKAESSFISRQSIARFVNLLASDEKIDAVVFYDGVNDVLHSCRRYLKVNEHGRTKQIRERLDSELISKKEEFLNYLDITLMSGTRTLAAKISSKLRKSSNFNIPSNIHNIIGIDQVDNIDQLLNCDNDKEKARQIAETLVNNWQIARDMAEARGIKFVAILQPVAYIGEPKLDHLKHLLSNENEQGKQYKTVYPIIRNIIRERGRDWILDYTDMFSRDENIYIDFCHVSRNGNRIIAEQIYEDIKNIKNQKKN